jgi:glyoxylase-like metal-dependent hydrolase (beta-lactamase superfamily II)
MATQRWQIGDATVTRVSDDDFELLVPQDERTTAAVLADAAWLAPWSITADGTLRIGSSATVIESRGTRIVVDPWLAFDPPDRSSVDGQARTERLLASIGDPASVDVVVNTHIDGSGANTRFEGGAEVPAFPAARYLLAASELEMLRSGRREGGGAFAALAAAGVLDHPVDGHAITDEVSLRSTPGHVDGHVVVEVSSAGASAVVIGHMFLHPAQIGNPDATLVDDDPERLVAERRALLKRCADAGTLLVGPLFADPGAGHVIPAGNSSWHLAAVEALGGP